MKCRVLPAWRPDKALNIDKPGFAEYLAKLGVAAGMVIRDWGGLIKALDQRMAFFHGMGCRLSDHAFEYLHFHECGEDEAAFVLDKALKGNAVSEHQAGHYKAALLLWLGKRYADLGWVMQLHVGATRNNNTRMYERLGPDTGFDAVADHPLSNDLAALLDALDRQGSLPRTILYSLNPKDNPVIASVLGCFQGGGVPGRVQFGSAWWFNDHRDGIERQMLDLANTGLLSRFVGMLTDSRSFLSYPRHEYFRRILCGLLGRWVEGGECPDDMGILEPVVRGVCYGNAKAWFGF